MQGMTTLPRIAATVTLALALAVAVASCGSGEQAGSTPATTPAATVMGGPDGYAFACASCHGAEGAGGQGPAVGGTLAGSKYDQISMVALITNGKGAMEGYAGDLPPATIEAIASYVRTSLGQ